MPYIEGESLRAKLARGGELPIGDAVRIMRDVVDALSEAHEHGVVHRDIKPS
jgi:serine/threonine-protein kinase